ncbi:MAG: cellulose biosynthesis protein BcsE [Vibrio sp.]
MFDLDYLSPSSMAPGIYIHTVSSQHLPLCYLESVLSDTYQTQCVAFHDWSKFALGYSPQQVQTLKTNFKRKTESVYFIGEKYQDKPLYSLAEDMLKIDFSASDMVLLIFPDSILTQSSFEQRHHFGHVVKRLSHKFQKPFVAVIYGFEHEFMHAEILRYPELYSGLVNLQALDAEHYLLAVPFWYSHLGIIYQYQYNLNLDKQTGLLQLDEKSTQKPSQTQLDDESQIYIVRSAVDSQQQSTEKMRIYETNQALVDQIELAQNATVILSILEQKEVKQLGVYCFSLRKKFGENLKLVVREMRQCLRYSDEMFLTQAGVNLIAGANINYARFLTMVETLQGQTMKRNLPSSIEHLLTFHVSSGRKGYIQPELFVEHTLDLIKKYQQSRTEFALIKFNLLPNINISAYLSMWDIKRDGDVLTVCDGVIYLLLNSVRANNIDVALRNIFKIPVQDAFLSQENFTTINRIEQELAFIKKTGVELDLLDTLEQQGFKPSQLLESRDSLDQESTLIFAQPKPLV